MQKRIKPSRPDLVVRDHSDGFRPLPAEGKSVFWDMTWQRRLRDGDVVEAPQQVKPTKPAPVVKPSAKE